MRMRRGEEVCAEASLDNHPFLPHTALAFASRLADFPRPPPPFLLVKKDRPCEKSPSLSLPTNYEIPAKSLVNLEFFFFFFFFTFYKNIYIICLFEGVVSRTLVAHNSPDN